MPPSASQAGVGKKNSALQRPSRNSTPVPAVHTQASLPPERNYDPDFLNSRVILFENLSLEDIVDHGSANATVPDSKAIDAMLEKLKSLTSIMEKRSAFYDRGMRFLADERKKRPDDYGVRPDGEHEGKRPKHKRKKVSDSLEPNDVKPHGKSSTLWKRKRSRDRDSASSSLSPPAPKSPSTLDAEKSKTQGDEDDDDESSSSDDGAPPRREAPKSRTFGEDPSTFPDPTIYEIREVHDGMSEAEKKEIFSVAVYPKSDLSHLVAGNPPDKDFSNSKPTSQINHTTFTSYIEPYFRPFSEEDLAFLRERGDRVSPFMIPKRGKRHYSEIWAEEEGSLPSEPLQDPAALNQPRGTIENMNDSTGETDSLSIGPLASRLLAAMRPEHRVPQEDKPSGNGMSNGDISMNGDMSSESLGLFSIDKLDEMPPASFMMESSADSWKKASHPKLDYAQVDERLKQELKYIGILPEETFELEYDDHYDDEVAGRLRELQRRLKDQMLINGARKARLTELVRERLAHQEYQTILEDLDGQVQGAYMKRTRTIGKSKKAKRPGGAGGGSHFVGGAAGMARPGIGDMTRTLMERRRRWIDLLGTVFNDEAVGKVPTSDDPDSYIFTREVMDGLISKEKEQWDEEVDED